METVAPEKAVVLQSADSSLFWGSIHLKVVCQTSTHLRCPFCSHKALLLVMSTMPPRRTHSLLWSLLCCGQMCLLHWQPAHPPRWEMMSLVYTWIPWHGDEQTHFLTWLCSHLLISSHRKGEISLKCVSPQLILSLVFCGGKPKYYCSSVKRLH